MAKWTDFDFLLCNITGSWRAAGGLARRAMRQSAMTWWPTVMGTTVISIICKQTTMINSLAPGRFQFNFRKVIFKLILVNYGWGISYEIALRWMPLDLTDDKSTLVQVMAWCRQATIHYLSQCWPRSMSPNGVTRPQWVNHKAQVVIDNIFKYIFINEK